MQLSLVWLTMACDHLGHLGFKTLGLDGHIATTQVAFEIGLWLVWNCNEFISIYISVPNMFSWCVCSPDWYSAQCAVGSLVDPLIGCKAMILASAWPHKNCFSSSAPQRRHDKIRLQRRFSNSWRVETNTAWEESFLRVTQQHPALKVQCFGCFTRLYTAICDPFGPMWPSQQTDVKIECIKYTDISTHTQMLLINW